MDLNQFNQEAVKGLITHGINNSIPVVIDDAEAGTLVPGQAVKLSDTANGKISVVKIAADTDEIFGIIPYVRNKSEFVAGESLEIILDNGILYMEAGAAIARGARVMPVVTGSKVITATTGKSIAGICLDKPTADGALIRVQIKTYLPKAL